MRPSKGTAALFVLGAFAFALAGLSIADMFLPRPYDGVVLESDAPTDILVRRVLPGSGAERAGVRAGERIVGIDRSALRSSAHAAALLNRHEIGDVVPYLVRGAAGLREVEVELGPRRLGDRSYLGAVLLGFSFFFIGLFVLLQQPQRTASQLLFVLGCLFLLFLVCRLRPASYSWTDQLVLSAGTAALVFLPASFLHFFLIFPRPIWDSAGVRPARPRLPEAFGQRIVVAGYVIPAVVLLGALGSSMVRGREPRMISGAPLPNWWVLAAFILLGLAALAANARRLPPSVERHGARLVLFGSLLGLVPFVIATVGASTFLRTERFVYPGLIPLMLVPLTFAYAIARYRVFDVRVVLRRGLLYTSTTAIVTALYALTIAAFSNLFRGSSIATASWFPLVFALTIVLLFDPLRRRLQGPVDRFFFADRARLQGALVEMGEAFNARLDPAAVVRDLVEELPRLLGLRFAALYLLKNDRFERTAGPANLPASIPLLQGFYRQVQSYTTLVQLEDLTSLRLNTPAVQALVDGLREAGVDVVGDLASSRRRIGLVLLSAKEGGGMPLEQEELRLLRGLLHQAAIALETSLLLEERARQAELERELEIAAEIQRSLLPDAIDLGAAWRVAATCRPARHVGGDFFTELPGPQDDWRAVIYGDVSGKSVPGALMMMAAKEALHSLSLAHRDPEDIIALANRRLYELSDRSFVAVGYLGFGPAGAVRYLLAGQPAPMRRRRDGSVEELPLPEHRLPLGAMNRDRHRGMSLLLEPGELLLAYSDGVIEAHSRGGELFGEERLAGLLAAAPADPDEVVRRVVAALEEFTAGCEAYDDVTLLAVAPVAVKDTAPAATFRPPSEVTPT